MIAAGEGANIADRSHPGERLRAESLAGWSRGECDVMQCRDRHFSEAFGVFVGCLARWAR